MQIPIRLLKPVLIKFCQETHEEQTDPSKDERFAIPIVDQKGNPIITIAGTISIVHNALSPTFFGAKIVVEKYYYELPSGVGDVEFMLTLPEVNNDVKIVEDLIRVNKVVPFKGNDIYAFMAEFAREIKNDWNIE